MRGSVTPHIIRHVFVFGLFATITQFLSRLFERQFQFDLGIEANPFEIAGAVLGLLLIFRTNASYDRWWEARKLWGGIVNQSRNLAITGLSYGPREERWRTDFIRWVAVFPHICRASLRGEQPCERVATLVGRDMAEQIGNSNHMPNFVALKIGQLLQEARAEHDIDQFAFIQADNQRAELIDHIGACERILKTPLPMVYVIKIRRFISLFLLALPLALIHRLNSDWLVPLVTLGVAYPVLALDQIGVELQNPFAKANLSHLPLDDISANIDKNVHALLAQMQSAPLDGVPQLSSR
ncbi:MAG TPA: bestrophin family ion channel [Abditibacterium sp.]